MENINEEEISLEDSVKEKEFEVEKIIRMRQRFKKDKKTKKLEKSREFLVKWKGYKKATWEPEENLENCQQLLVEFYNNKNMPRKKKQTKDFKSYQIYANHKPKQRFRPNNSGLKSNKKLKRKNIQIEDPSTFSNSYTNNFKAHFNKKDPNEIAIVEDKVEEVNMPYDIEIVDDDNEETKIASESKVKREGKKEPKVFQITDLDEEKKNVQYEVYNEAPVNLDKYEHSVYLDEEDNDIKINQKLENEENQKNKENKSKVLKYLEKKILRENNYEENDKKSVYSEENDNKFKVIGIYNMRVPSDNEKGIIVSIKYKKNNKIFLEEFNTQLEEVPSEYLARYYEMFICENFKGKTYSQELCFD